MSDTTPHDPITDVADELPDEQLEATRDALPPPATPATEVIVLDPYGASEQALSLDDLMNQPEDPHEGATPPGYEEWPTHGGYLGCLMGVVLALVLAPVGYILFGLIGSALYRPLGYAGVWLAGIVTVIAFIACFVALTRLGWRLGKRFYREYPQPLGQPAIAGQVIAGEMIEGEQV